jgi:hypothetical protein
VKPSDPIHFEVRGRLAALMRSELGKMPARKLVPGAESNIGRKQLIYNASLNEISAWANTEANAISALKNRGFDSRR